MQINTIDETISGLYSSIITLTQRALVRVTAPASIASNACYFDVTYDNGATWIPLMTIDGSTTYEVSLVGNRSYPIPPEITRGAPAIRVRLSNSETAKTFTFHTGTL